MATIIVAALLRIERIALYASKPFIARIVKGGEVTIVSEAPDEDAPDTE